MCAVCRQLLLVAIVASLTIAASAPSTWNSRHGTFASRAAAFAQRTLSRFAFGSCAKGEAALAPLMVRAVRENAEVWIWGGDAIYADVRTSPLPGFFAMAPLAQIASLYEARRAEAAYAALASRIPVLGMYDDHESLNNCDGTLPLKRETKELYLKYILDEPADSPLWAPDRGAYVVHTFGQLPQQVKIVLLDVRYHRVMGGDALGADQWAYLERELRHSDAALHFVVSPIQVMAFDKFVQEKMSAQGDSYVRLARLLNSLAGVVFLSGDVHTSGFIQSGCGFSYMVTEFTSSGLTHTIVNNTGALLASWLARGPLRSRFNVGPLVIERSFGLVEIDWAAQRVNLSAVTEDGQRPAHLSLQMAHLQPQPGAPIDWSCVDAYNSSIFTMGGQEFFLVAGVGLGGAAVFGACLGAYVYFSCRARRQRAKALKKTH